MLAIRVSLASILLACSTPILPNASAQSAQWVQRPIAVPSGDTPLGLEYDAARGEMILFVRGVRQTYAYTGESWDLRTSGQGPTFLGGDSCYDSTRQRMVLVSGNQSTGLETWEWNGSSWSLRLAGASCRAATTRSCSMPRAA